MKKEAWPLQLVESKRVGLPLEFQYTSLTHPNVPPCPQSLGSQAELSNGAASNIKSSSMHGLLVEVATSLPRTRPQNTCPHTLWFTECASTKLSSSRACTHYTHNYRTRRLRVSDWPVVRQTGRQADRQTEQSGLCLAGFYCTARSLRVCGASL